MTILVRIPAALRDTCAGARELSMEAPTIAAALGMIEQQHPLLYRSICNETGMVRQHIGLFVNKSLVRGPEGLTAQLAQGDVVTVMPAVSGG